MTTLAGSTLNPNIVVDKLSQLDMKSEGSPEIEELQERLAEWKAFQRTREYTIVSNLAEPYITRIRSDLSKSVIELHGSMPTLSVDEINELRAEWRGELRWWEMMVHGIGIMERRLSELEADEKKDEERPRETPKAVRKYT